MKQNGNGRLKEKLSNRPQFNTRLPIPLTDKIKAEIARQGRKRDAVAIRVWSYFLGLKAEERDSICRAA